MSVCHVPTSTPINPPAGNRIAAVPVATDLNSALLAINVLRKIVHDLLNRPGPGNNTHDAGSAPHPPPKPGRWVESRRSTSKVKITNPDDETQFVEIERINRLTMRDTATGAEWTWSRERT